MLQSLIHIYRATMGGQSSSYADADREAPVNRNRRNSADSLSLSNDSWHLPSDHGSFRSMIDQREISYDNPAFKEPLLERHNLQRSFSFHGSSGLRGRYLSDVKPHLYKHPEDNWEIESLNFARLSSHQRKTISCLWAAKLVYYISFGMQPVALPAIVEENNLGTSATGTLFATWAFATIIFWPIWRISIEKIGSKNLLIIGLFLNGLSFLLFGCLHFEESWMRFIVLAYILKLIEGAGFAALEIAVTIKTLVEFPRHESGAYGSVQNCIGIGVTIGAAVGGFFYSIADVASTFILLGILVFLVGLVAVCMLQSRPYISPVITESAKRKTRFLRQTTVHSSIIMYFFGIFAVSCLFSILEPHIREIFSLNFTVEGILLAVIPLGFVFGVAFWQWLITHDYVCGLDCVSIFGLLVFGLTFLFLGPCKAFKIPNDLLWLHVICFLITGGSVSMAYTASLNALLETAEVKKMNKLSAYSTVSTILMITLCIAIAAGSCIGGYLNQEFGFQRTTTVFAAILFIVALLDAVYALIKTAVRLGNYNRIQKEIEQQNRLLSRQGHTSRAAIIGASLATTKGLYRYTPQTSRIQAQNDRRPLLESDRPKGRTYGTYL